MATHGYDPTIASYRPKTIILVISTTLTLIIFLILNPYSISLTTTTATASTTTTTSTSTAPQHPINTNPKSSHIHPPDLLSSSSTILITGAAGFIGSQLAITLHRLYSPQIILVDYLLPNGASFLNNNNNPSSSPKPPSSSSSSSSSSTHEFEDSLATIEYKRQRLFYVLQTLGDRGTFYKTDFRPSIPDYHNVGEVSILNTIFKTYNITHVVHLADDGVTDKVIARVKDQTKAGMMESLLESLMGIDESIRPHLTYGSGHEVYAATSVTGSKMSRCREGEVMTAPRSLKGARMLMDEILARTYADLYGVYSVGLRFFGVYGPWGNPQSAIFEMMERAVSDRSGEVLPEGVDGREVLDWVYVDDAVDAILAGMQYRPLRGEGTVTGSKWPAVAFNVGTGSGVSYGEVRDILQYYFPRTTKEEKGEKGQAEREGTAAMTAVADVSLAKQHLGFQSIVPFRSGLIQTLAWHYDRGNPYSPPKSDSDSKSNQYTNAFIASHGSESCNPFDADCLKGTPVFPCASECAKRRLCLPSPYDEVLPNVAKITKDCDTVLYSIELNTQASNMLAAAFGVMPTKTPFLPPQCQIVFVNKDSPLAKSTLETWTLIPITIPSSTPNPNYLNPHTLHLPKFSPSLFFPHTTTAIYTSPQTLITHLPSLLETYLTPHPHIRNSITAILTSYQPPTYLKTHLTEHTRVQERAYDAMVIAFAGELSSASRKIDSDWMVYRLKSMDTLMFRCDVYSELISWEVDDVERALVFIAGMHSLWSRVVYKEEKKTVTGQETNQEQRRRLLETKEEEEEEGSEEGMDGEVEKNEAFNEKLEKRVVEKEEKEDQLDIALEEEWLGVLGSGSKRLFVRFLDQGGGNVVKLDEYGL